MHTISVVTVVPKYFNVVVYSQHLLHMFFVVISLLSVDETGTYLREQPDMIS